MYAVFLLLLAFCGIYAVIDLQASFASFSIHVTVSFTLNNDFVSRRE